MRKGINCSNSGFGRGRSGLAFLALAAGLLAPALAFAVPVATTQVSKLCELRAANYGFDQYDSGLQPFAQATACDLSAANAQRPWSCRRRIRSGFSADRHRQDGC